MCGVYRSWAIPGSISKPPGTPGQVEDRSADRGARPRHARGRAVYARGRERVRPADNVERLERRWSGCRLNRDAGRDAQGLEHHAVALGQLFQRGDLVGRGVGVELEPQPDRAKSHGCVLAHAQRPPKVEISLCPDLTAAHGKRQGYGHRAQRDAGTGHERLQQQVARAREHAGPAGRRVEAGLDQGAACLDAAADLLRIQLTACREGDEGTRGRGSVGFLQRGLQSLELVGLHLVAPFGGDANGRPDPDNRQGRDFRLSCGPRIFPQSTCSTFLHGGVLRSLALAILALGRFRQHRRVGHRRHLREPDPRLPAARHVPARRARFPGRPRGGPTARHRAGRRLSLSPGRMSLSAADARLLLLGATLVSCAAPHRAASPPRDPDAAIRAALAATAAGWNRGDLDQYLSAYTDSATSAGPDGFVTGKAAAAAVMRSGFWRSGRPTQQLGYDHLVIRPLGADHALVTGRYLLTGGGQPERTGWFTTVWV